MKRAPIKELTDLVSLKNQLKVRAEQEKLAEQKRQEEQRIAQQEAQIFQRGIGAVTPIKQPDIYQHQRTIPAAPSTTPRPKEITSMAQAMQVMEQWSDEFDASQWQDGKEGQGEFCYSVKGSSPDLLTKLRKGQWPVQAFLDLHGMQRDQARTALSDFLRRSTQARLRCVCIIHGKGINSRTTAVLPAKVRSWLTQSEWVQAFCPASHSDGGEGALQVLLQSERS